MMRRLKDIPAPQAEGNRSPSERISESTEHGSVINPIVEETTASPSSPSTNLVANVVPSKVSGISSMDEGLYMHEVTSRLLKEHIIMLNGEITDKVASNIVSQLLFLEAEDSSREINLYINSPGGSVTSGLAILDTMNHIKPVISTVCIGQACSMASVLLAAGTPGKRIALPNSRVMVHQPLAPQIGGQAADMAIRTNEVLRVRKLLDKIYSDLTGKEIGFIKEKIDRDHYMTPQQALEFGLVDKVVVPRKQRVDDFGI